MKGERSRRLDGSAGEPPSVAELWRRRRERPARTTPQRRLGASLKAGSKRVKEAFYRGFVLGFLLGVGILLLSGHVH